MYLLILAKLAIVACWATFIIFVARTFLPSPMPVSYPKTRNTFMFLPEGWGYFTRNPREPVLQLYGLDAKHEPVLTPNFSTRSLFGLRRDGRRVGGEVDIVLSQVPANAWSTRRGGLNFESYLPDSTVVIQNTVARPTLCGDYLIQLQDRMPWAWARSRDSLIMPSKVARVRVECE